MTHKKMFRFAALGVLSLTNTSWAQDAEGLEEIIVTAEKREESLQKTALAVAALGSETLVDAGVSQAQDLNKLVPGLGIGTGAGSASQIYLRGVGTYSITALSDPAVAFNIDGVYLARSTAINGNFYDVERVEVLKGPQGTLYGRNATGGAVNIVSQKPKKNFEAGVGLDVGNYDLIKVDGFVNLPASDVLSMRLAAQRTRRDGYQTDGYDDDDSTGARLHVLFDPSDQFKLLVTGSYLRLKGKGSANVPVTASGFVDNSNPWRGMSETAPIALTGVVPGAPADYLTNGLDFASGYLDVTVKSLSAQVDSNLGFGDLTVIVNHMQTDNGTKSYQPIFLFWQDDTAKQNSLEARLSGDTGPIRWVGGLYYFKEDQNSRYWVDQGYTFNQTGVDLDQLDDTTYAAFGEVTYSLTERLRFVAGARYTKEKKEQNGYVFNKESVACAAMGSTEVSGATVAASIPQAATNGSGTPYLSHCRDTMTGERTWNDTSWKVGANFDVAVDSMMYFTVSRGFKAGGFFAAGDHSDVGNVYEPETLVAYALGSKNRFFGSRLQLNGEVFYWDYKDHQENYLAPQYLSVPSFGLVTQNADAEIYGLDVELDALLSDYDQLSLKGQYLHGEYTNAVFTVASPAELSSGVTVPPSTVCTPTRITTARYTIDCTGQQMPRSPEISLSGGYYHTFNLGNRGAIIPGVSFQYSASYWTGVEYNSLQKQDAFTTYGATLAYESSEKNFSVTAYGDNLTNEAIYQNSFMRPGATAVSTNALRAPRTYGVRFGAKFQ